MNADAWGVASAYRDASGRARIAPEATVRALLGAMGAQGESPPQARVVVTRRGDAPRLPGAGAVVTEDGRRLPLADGVLPRDLELGYHRVLWRDGADSRLVVSPGRCHLPAGLRTWGWALQLYSVRSGRTWGMGDLGTLREVVEWARGLGAGMTMINPLHATSPGAPQEASPYFPGSRLWRNPLYISIDDVPGAGSGDERLDELRAAGRALNRDARIDRDAVYALKLEALERLWARRAPDAGFDAFVRRHGALLQGFATFQALAEAIGPEPASWPPGLRHPGSGAVARFRAEHADRVGFHCWLQWLLDEQLGRAAPGGGLVQDLAVGVAPGGADAWVWQDVLVRGARVGAPPDVFNALGQDWGVLPFDPWKLRAAEYEPFAQAIRWSLARGGGLRVDHVMGLWRLFWIPDGAPPAEGAYVRYPAADLLDILSLESVRASAYIVGEDLGTVEAAVRREMAARAMLSYRILWFEDEPPSRWPRRALAAVTNHDLPTVAGVWSGDDVEVQRSLGLLPDEDAHAALRARLARRLGLRADAPVDDVIEGVHRMLARAPSALLAAQLEDALGVRERPNHPGTTTEWPNWSRPLPVPLEELRTDARVGAIARALADR
ncbi:MAG TPA: 4-alpha-glucanotransferase [Actinomycetota bacterium]|nr:4-alpha-glucanotransferase [Actinomycetota bacterium]